MPTRNVVVTVEQAAMIDALVQSGRYQNASEVLRDGLRLVQEREDTHAAKLAALREAVAVGDADIEAGRYLSFSANDDLRGYLNALVDAALERQRP